MRLHSIHHRRMVTAAAILAVLPSAVAIAASRTRAAHSVAVMKVDAACAALSADYETDSKKLSLSNARAMGEDRGAQRNDAAILTHATMTMNLMAAHGCKVPTSAPAGDRYAKAAIFCSLAKDTQEAKYKSDWSFADIDGGRTNPYPPPITSDPPECDMAKWQPNGAAR